MAPLTPCAAHVDPPSEIRWDTPGLRVRLRAGRDEPVSLRSTRPAGSGPAPTPGPGATPPLVEVLALGHGRFPGSHRYADTELGARLRYRQHVSSTIGGQPALRVEQLDVATGLVVTSVLVASGGAAALRSWTEVRLEGETALTLQAVTSAVIGTFVQDPGTTVDALDVLWAENDWVAESRWHRDRLRDVGLPDIDVSVHAHASRSRFPLTSHSSWSSGERLPTGAVTDRDGGWTVAWQVEHNGAWHAEIGETAGGAYLALLGPTDAEHHWSVTLEPGDAWSSVPVAVAVGTLGVDDALGELTEHRRALVASAAHGTGPGSVPVIFNDYMNTLMGDPTTDRLLPLVDAAAGVGADVFVIDAGWYDEDGSWWDSVGRWTPSATRFPGGLQEVLDHIRGRGMTPGIWLEPEVVGVRSPLAHELPEGAFLSRGGQRVVEHGRFHLDLRHPAAVEHLDAVVDRLVGQGVGYLKLDYNIMAGPGSDRGGLAPGEGLLQHNRAHLAWLDGVLARHPGLLVENCASGAMRMDYALMSRLHIQSTSDQQNPLLYPHIAATAPASLLPEQCGNWAYAQATMTPEEAAFTLALGLGTRLYLSGYLNRMDPEQVSLVRDAVAVHRELLPLVTSAVPFWPLGLDAPTDAPWVVAGLRAPAGTLLSVWRRPGAGAQLTVPVPHLRGRDVVVDVLFPRRLSPWEWCWDQVGGVLHVTATNGAPTARVVRVRERGADEHVPVAATVASARPEQAQKGQGA